MGVFEDGSENVGDVSEFVNGQAVASIAISLKRIADALDGPTPGILADRLGESIYNAITQAAIGMNRR
jgi:hypothetical protein